MVDAPRQEPAPVARRYHWTRWLIVFAAAALVAWLLYRRWMETGFEWSRFGASFLHLRWEWLAGSYLLAFLTYYGRVLRWAVLIRPLKSHPSRTGLFSATAIGFTALVLFGRPGEFVRPYLIAMKERLPLSSQLAAWFLERVLDLLAILLIFGFALTQVSSSRAGLGPALSWVLETGGWIAAGLSLVCLAVLIFLRNHADAARRRLLEALSFLKEHQRERAERLAGAFVEGTAATKGGRSLLLLAFYTGLEWVLITLCYVALFRAYRIDFGVQDVIVFMGFVSFGSIIQIPGIGGGVQLVSILVLTQMYRFPLEVATSLAVMLWITTFVVIVPFGLAFAFHEGLNWNRIKQMEKQATF